MNYLGMLFEGTDGDIWFVDNYAPKDYNNPDIPVYKLYLVSDPSITTVKSAHGLAKSKMVNQNVKR